MQKQDNFNPNCNKCSWSHSDTYDKCCDENMTDDEITDHSLCFFAQWDKRCKICRVKNYTVKNHISARCSSCIWEGKC